MPVVSISLDDAILDSLDQVAHRRNYRSRSEAVREALREFIDATEWGREGGQASVILAVIYRKDSPKAEGQPRIYVAGEKSFARMAKYRTEGIPLGAKVVDNLKQIGTELGVAWPGP